METRRNVRLTNKTAKKQKYDVFCIGPTSENMKTKKPNERNSETIKIATDITEIHRQKHHWPHLDWLKTNTVVKIYKPVYKSASTLVKNGSFTS